MSGSTPTRRLVQALRASVAPARRRRLAWWAGFGALVVATLALRVGLDARAELEAAAEARRDGDARREIRHLGRAARWRAPIATHDERARARLEAIGASAAVAGDPAVALEAYRELRRALWATRAWGKVADPQALARADEFIAHRMADRGQKDLAPEAARRRAELAADPTPNAAGTGVAALAFVIWLAAIVGFLRHAIDREGRLRPRPAVRRGAAVFVSLIVWVLLMRYPGWLG